MLIPKIIRGVNKLKNISIITFHFVNNCGAMLQCLAINEYVKKEGFSVQTIDYRPGYLRASYDAFPNPLYNWKVRLRETGENRGVLKYKHLIKAVVYSVRQWKNAVYKHKQNVEFGAYLKKKIHMTKRYNSFAALKKDPPKSDYYICGSDQIWNISITDQILDEAYLLSFVKTTEGKKISYAASVGQIESEEFYIELVQKTADFYKVSFRELSCVNLYNNIGIKKAVSVCDPVFLFNADWWRKQEAVQNYNKGFILVYMLFQSKEIEDYLKDLQCSGIKIINISPYRIGLQKFLPTDNCCTPDKFLWYIDNAERVITNSFHATAFSIIFNKQITCFSNPKTGTRLKDLLNEMRMSDHLFDINGRINREQVEITIDYEKISKNIIKYSDKGKKFLEKVLTEGEN